jgi:streptogramin lyase
LKTFLLALFAAAQATAAQSVRLPLDSLPIVARIAVPSRPDWLAMGFGSVWVVDYRPPSVARIDPATNRVVSSIPLPGDACLGLAMTRDAVWVPDCTHHVVVLIDPERAVVAATVAAGVPTPWGDITTGAGAVWVSVNGTPVTRIDPVTHAVTHQYVGGSGADAIRYGFGSLWVSDHEHGEVWRIDPSRIVAPAGKRQ